MICLKHLLFGLLAAATLIASGCKEEDELKVDIAPTQKNVCEEMAEVVCQNSFQCGVG